MSEENEKRAAGSPEEPATPEAPTQPVAQPSAAAQPAPAGEAPQPAAQPPTPRPKRLRGFAKRKSVQLVAVALLGAVVGGVVGIAGAGGGHRHGHEFAKYGGGDRPEGRFERGPGSRFEVPDRFDR
ncbi:hypothetical protein N8J89_40255 [Crossiella sp. CA-258035]|uniref:hypothetical protein n=1 Tax=Crossiella sp. CA-258035 TaxID=2981138 RepID=UPI0024BCEAD9|nr:hypothetical protein [Crossiella sp. CA-258035]WHT19252.1 hypothetical protein N8J89_40255 [Crossiella sp. CA-258035]